jgi:hypothetical protein
MFPLAHLVLEIELVLLGLKRARARAKTEARRLGLLPPRE